VKSSLARILDFNDKNISPNMYLGQGMLSGNRNNFLNGLSDVSNKHLKRKRNEDGEEDGSEEDEEKDKKFGDLS
jgi:hypothetical protein